LAILAFAASAKDSQVLEDVTDKPLACSRVGLVGRAARRADFRGGAGEVSDCWRLRGAMVGFCSLEGKEEGVGCCAKLEKAPRSTISRLQ
jgi:hypothetical protein